MEQDQVKYILLRIWPATYKIINSVFYFLLTLFKTIVVRSIKQIKGDT